MSETWEDIVGSTEKPMGSLVPKEPPKIYRHESEEETTKRRAKCLEAIFTVMPDSQWNADGMTVHSEMFGKKFDFYPSSDCYYIHSTQKYGTDIQRLCEQIMKFALKHEKG